MTATRVSHIARALFTPMMGLAVILSSCGRATNPAANSQSAKLMERPGSAGVRSLTRPSSYVHLFEWTWRDVAKECEKVLGPAGVDAVQISPPQEHRLMPGSPWFQRYQPVSYRLESRSGTRAEFIDMVNRCQKAGVDVISDAVVNHMAQTLPFNQSETGWAGSSYSRYNYPGLFAFADFHHCGRYSDNVIRNYQDRWEVQNCELLGLADLNTGNDSVRGKIADFLNDQLSIGVRGFRIDAAKHMAPGDIGAIVSQLRNSPFVFQEVIDQGGEPVSAIEYLDNGSVTEFRVGLALAALFRRGNLSALGSMGESWGFVPSRKAVVFTDNHDNQRGHGGGGPVLTYRDGTLHTLANLFLLGFNYGSVGIMSSYDFSRESDGPPVNSDGQTRPVYTEAGLSNCGKGQWICEHRDTTLLSMLKFRRTVGSAPVIKWWSSESGAQIAFSRGDQGWFALNIEGKSSFVSVQTSLPDGLYCDSLSGMKYAGDPKSCSGQRVEIRDGTAQVVIPGMSAVAITLQERINFN